MDIKELNRIESNKPYIVPECIIHNLKGAQWHDLKVGDIVLIINTDTQSHYIECYNRRTEKSVTVSPDDLTFLSYTIVNKNYK